MVETETATVHDWTSSEEIAARDSLHPHYNYECSVAAHTAGGTGPYSQSQTVQTLSTGITKSV